MGWGVIVSHYTLTSIMIQYELHRAVAINCQYTYCCPSCVASHSVPISNAPPSTPNQPTKPILNTNVIPSTCSITIHTLTCIQFLSYAIYVQHNSSVAILQNVSHIEPKCVSATRTLTICILPSKTQHMNINIVMKYQLHQGYLFRP